MISQILFGFFASVASSDTNRDIFFAEAIASGRYFPLIGPEINHTIHLGPLWYYLLAPSVWCISSAAAVTAMMAAISASQFPLAYVLGRRFGTAQEAILFVCALAIPGWMTVSFASMTHTLLVVPACLFTAFAATAYRDRPSMKRALLTGIGVALMATAHPTTALFALLLLVWAALQVPRRRDLITHGALAVSPALLSLAPMVFAQWRNHLGDMGTLISYSNGGWHMPSLTSVAQQIYADVVYGPKYLLRFLLDSPVRAEHAWFAAYAALIALALIGLILRLRRRGAAGTLVLTVLTVLFAQAYFVCTIRSSCPPWMVYAQWPMVAALVALGLSTFWSFGRSGRALVTLMLGAMVGLTMWSYWVFSEGSPDHAEIKSSPGKLGAFDIRDYEKAKYAYRLPRVPFAELFGLGKPLCQPSTLYGHYAYIVDYTFAVSAAATCGSVSQVEFGGPPQEGRQALFALTDVAWRSAQLAPERWVASLGIATPKQVWSSPVALAPVLPRLENFSRDLKPQTRDFVVDGDASDQEAVVVAHRAHRYVPFEVLGATANGEPIVAAYEDLVTVVFRAPPNATAPVHWRVNIRGTSDYIDVLTVPARAMGIRPAGTF